MSAPSGLSPDLAKEYLRWAKKLPDDEPRRSHCVTADEILRAHFLIVDHFARTGAGEGVGGVGPIDDQHFGLLLSAVARQHGVFGDNRWKDVFDLTATVFFAVAKNHIFHDANKRTALLTALYQLQRSEWVADAPHREFDRIAVDTAASNLSAHTDRKRFDEGADGDVRFLSSYFRRRTRRTDNKQRVITYRQLDQLLRRFGYYLDSPAHNRIDIVHDEIVVERSLFGLRRKESTIKKRVGNIGFPGWTKQVAMKDLKDAREATRTSGSDGIDSQRFYDGLDPIESLIPQYEGALRRLADR